MKILIEESVLRQALKELNEAYMEMEFGSDKVESAIVSMQSHIDAAEKAIDEIESLRQQLAAIPDIRVQEAALVGENMILKQQLAECEAERNAFQDQCISLKMKMTVMREERDELRQICRDAYEVWAGSEGIPEPVYASEAYLYQLLINMRDEVKRALAKVGADKTGDGS